MTAQLVQAYNEAGDDRDFEIVLFGYDRDQAGMENYLKSSNISFPAVKIAEKESLPDLAKLGFNGGIPAAVMITAGGEMVASTPGEVIAKLTQ